MSLSLVFVLSGIVKVWREVVTSSNIFHTDFTGKGAQKRDAEDESQ